MRVWQSHQRTKQLAASLMLTRWDPQVFNHRVEYRVLSKNQRLGPGSSTRPV